jgi:hypothetical protein
MAGAVKGSRQTRMVVVPYRPWLPAALIAGTFCVVLLAALAGLYWGYYGASREHIEVGAENVLLSDALIQAQEQVAELRAQLAMSGQDTLLDQRAEAEVQSTINSLRGRIRQLEQDVSFYRQVMAPDSSETGLVIENLRLELAVAPAAYRYRVFVRVAGAGDEMVRGSVQLSLQGQQDGLSRTYELRELAAATAEVSDTLDFRYFQTLEGEFELPSGFIPEAMLVHAQSSHPEQYLTERRFNWTVEEI